MFDVESSPKKLPTNQRQRDNQLTLIIDLDWTDLRATPIRMKTSSNALLRAAEYLSRSNSCPGCQEAAPDVQGDVGEQCQPLAVGPEQC